MIEYIINFDKKTSTLALLDFIISQNNYPNIRSTTHAEARDSRTFIVA